MSKCVYHEDKKFISKRKYSIDEQWIQDLGLVTQITAKKGKISLNHGRLLYSIIREYVNYHNISNSSSLNIVETGTARGFSSLCMAKALFDSQTNGKILTFDVLPHERSTYWNNITDSKKRYTRQELLKPWSDLTNNYILFIEGDTLQMLQKISPGRVNIAFLDACHTYHSVINECKIIAKYQIENDIIVFDDVNKTLFPGVVKAIQVMSTTMNYSLTVYDISAERKLVVAQKLKPLFGES